MQHAGGPDHTIPTLKISRGEQDEPDDDERRTRTRNSNRRTRSENCARRWRNRPAITAFRDQKALTGFKKIRGQTGEFPILHFKNREFTRLTPNFPYAILTP